LSVDPRFPITRVVDPGAFATLAADIGAHPNLALDGTGADDDARDLIARHLAELFFFRRDVLARFLLKPKSFSLHRDASAFRAAGGVSGGCYLPQKTRIVLLRSRLFEGFGGEWPGVAPLLHELGHMLDHLNPRTGGGRWRCAGLLPGLDPRDGAIHTPRARVLFLAGRALERKRYAANMRVKGAIPPPIGHPYVFQNDGEFCAGYLEMFLRNPNAFARMNETLFAAYTTLFGWDPRAVWPRDFAFYLDANRAVYAADG
jgi:hypothetical protein